MVPLKMMGGRPQSVSVLFWCMSFHVHDLVDWTECYPLVVRNTDHQYKFSTNHNLKTDPCIHYIAIYIYMHVLVTDFNKIIKP